MAPLVSSSIKRRLLTGFGMAGAVLAALYLLPTPAFAALFGMLAVAAAWEWAGLAGFAKPRQRILCAAGLGGFIVLGLGASELLALAPWVGFGVWLLAIGGILAWPAGAALWRRGWLMALVGGLMLWCAWAASVLVHARAEGPHWLFGLIMLVSLVDSGAYFAGRAWGRRKLAPGLSPGKTWEGVAGGAGLGLLTCTLILMLLDRFSAALFGLMLILVAFAIFGDLWESLVKRVSGVKDSGALLPGHGGLLDRIDSELAALPAFALLAPAWI